MPHVVLLFDVPLKSHRLVVKLVPLQACRGAEVGLRKNSLLLLYQFL